MEEHIIFFRLSSLSSQKVALSLSYYFHHAEDSLVIVECFKVKIKWESQVLTKGKAQEEMDLLQKCMNMYGLCFGDSVDEHN